MKTNEKNIKTVRNCSECNNKYCSLHGDKRFFDCGRMSLYDKRSENGEKISE